MSCTHQSLDLLNIITDDDVEAKHQRYEQLLGHVQEIHTRPISNWNDKFLIVLRHQAKQKEEWNSLTEQEKSLDMLLLKFEDYNCSKKVYIKQCEQCSICFDPIINNKSGYLTECGHAMHKKCITKYYNSSYNRIKKGRSFKWHIACPICRNELIKCTWLERRYSLEPWRHEFRKKPRCNLDYEFQEELLSHDILCCTGCKCTPGCGNIVGTGYHHGCKACYMWRHTSVRDLRNHTVNECKINKKQNLKRLYWCSLMVGVRHFMYKLVSMFI